MQKATKLITDNPELLLYLDDKLHITILGGIKLTGFDRLKVTLKIVCAANTHTAFRHNLDLYNSIQAEQLIEKSAEALDVAAAELSKTISGLTTALEDYSMFVVCPAAVQMSVACVTLSEAFSFG
jgi:hypothetical protein